MTTFVQEFVQLRADVIVRWTACWDRIDECEAKLPPETTSVYTDFPAFSLDSYSGGELAAGARLFDAPSGRGSGYRFELDGSGRPLRVRSEHARNGVSWDGIYRYAPTEVENIEWCLETGVPCRYERLLLDDDIVIAHQRLVVNGGGYSPAWWSASRSQVIDEILGNDHNHVIFLWRYPVQEGVTMRGEECHNTDEGAHRATLEYAYAPDGKLQSIVQHRPAAVHLH
ncbi:hypothetical protein [Smaragdicoccus niigatensis]|uniref:hypothetical protein n=1 Tax=Smaragdicoccus niigatensis TaxID=359359 RepID=UPI00036EA269|nr:hypothetical protein [Smaragdicoccus niigatensis]